MDFRLHFVKNLTKFFFLNLEKNDPFEFYVNLYKKKEIPTV